MSLPRSLRLLSNATRHSQFFSCSVNPADAVLRRAQAVEVFREAYSNTAGTATTITASDLDMMVMDAQVRPSVFINVYSVLGTALGVVSKLSPSVVSSSLSNAVDEAAKMSLNDKIRDCIDKPEMEEVLDALKFHRDVTIIGDTEVETNCHAVDASAEASPGSCAEGKASSMFKIANIDMEQATQATKNSITIGLHKALEVSDNL